MHQVQIEVLQTQVLESVLDGQLDVFGVVVQLEQLGSDKDLFTRDTGRLDTLADLGFVTVRPGAAVMVLADALFPFPRRTPQAEAEQ